MRPEVRWTRVPLQHRPWSAVVAGGADGVAACLAWRRRRDGGPLTPSIRRALEGDRLTPWRDVVHSPAIGGRPRVVSAPASGRAPSSSSRPWRSSSRPSPTSRQTASFSTVKNVQNVFKTMSKTHDRQCSKLRFEPLGNARRRETIGV